MLNNVSKEKLFQPAQVEKSLRRAQRTNQGRAPCTPKSLRVPICLSFNSHI